MGNFKELCWLMTVKCNQDCKYCHRFTNKIDIREDEYIKILLKLSEYGVRNITLGGGEPFLVDNIVDIVNLSEKLNIKLKVVSNGTLLLEKENIDIINKLARITLSLDSTNNEINRSLGRGLEHYENIRNILEILTKNSPATEIGINSVATKINLSDFCLLHEFIKEYPISNWRIFRFCPIREKSLVNQDMFAISEEEFYLLKNQVQSFNSSTNVDFRNYEDMSTEYLLITPEGDLCISDNLKDIVVGNMLKDDLSLYFSSKS